MAGNDDDARSAGTPKGGPRPLERPFLLLAVATVSILFLAMVRDFLIALLLAAICAGMTSRFYRRVLGWVRHPAVAAAAIVLALLVIIVGPLAAFLGIVAAQALEVRGAVEPWLARLRDPGTLEETIRRLPLVGSLPLEAFYVDQERLTGWIGSAVSRVGGFAASNLAVFTQSTAEFLLELFVFLYALFFFLMQGRPLLDRMLYYVPLRREDEEVLVQRFVSVTRATLKGSLVIGFLQGTLAGFGFWIAGIGGWAFWGTVMMVLSIIPGLGAPLVWVPVVIWLFATGEATTGLVLAAWCGAVVGTLDNVLRPRLVGADAQMSELMILLSTLGGISLFGVTGVLIGPIVAALFVTIFDLYGHAFREVLPASGALRGPSAERYPTPGRPDDEQAR